MTKLISPSSLTASLLKDATIQKPVRVKSKTGDIFDISRTNGAYPYIVCDVANMSHFSCSTVLEVKQLISYFI